MSGSRRWTGSLQRPVRRHFARTSQSSSTGPDSASKWPSKRLAEELRVAEVPYTLTGTCRILSVRPDEYLEKAALRAIRNTNQRDVLSHEMAEN